MVQPADITINFTLVNGKCPEDNAMTMVAEPTGGTPPYTYQWSNGATSTMLTNVPHGSYTLTITDNKSCQKQEIFTFSKPEPFVLAKTIQKSSCPLVADGSVYVKMNGGTPPYQYLWSNNSEVFLSFSGRWLCVRKNEWWHASLSVSMVKQ